MRGDSLRVDTIPRLHWVVEPTEHLAAIRYAARILSTLLRRRAEFLTTPPEHSDATIWYRTDPPESTEQGLWIRPDTQFWAALQHRRDTTPRQEVLWNDTVFPAWDRSPRSAGAAGSRSTAAPADPIAATFFLISRLEERGGHSRDRHGRYRARHAWMVAYGLIERPLIHEYAAAIGRALGMKDTAEAASSPWPEGKRFAVALTHDVDRLRMHGPVAMEAVRAISSLRVPGGARAFPARLHSRWRVGRGDADDPYDTIERIADEHLRRGFQATFLWIADEPTRQNSDYRITDNRVGAILARLRDQGFEHGLHGSYGSYRDPAMLTRQRRALEQATGATVRATRQHYLRLQASQTWRAQIAAGLAIDSTLGFAERFGFRAGIAVPFRPWSMSENRALEVWEVPLVMMDGTAKEYMKIDPATASAHSRDLIARMQDVGAGSALLWHNSSLNEIDWRGWSSVYETWLDEITARSGWAATLSDIVDAWQSHVHRLGNDEPVG